MNDPIVVAVFNSSEDTTDMLRVALEGAGYVVVTALTHALRDGTTDLESLMRQHRPTVIVYDVALPYDPNWRLFEHMRRSPVCSGAQFVVTSTNVAHVRTIAGPDQPLLEIVGKPYDLNQLLERVADAAPVSAQPGDDDVSTGRR